MLGLFEIDTVHHCGERDAGEFCLTLDAADVASGWVELRPLGDVLKLLYQTHSPKRPNVYCKGDNDL
ncbi:MAG: hypothetical protein LBF60_00610, partial [Treponema sp.]|nr:hypothetical protein [Treponema sp.]